MPDYPAPAHPLSDVKERARVGFLNFRDEALDGAGELDFVRQDIVDCILGLKEGDFHKCMDAENPAWAGCKQDVYKTTYEGVELYVKIQYWPLKTKRLYVVSFKRK